jgi:hypothetical protein
MTDPLFIADQWVQEAMFGRTATLIAMIAIAALGARMLTGNIDRRSAVSTIIGCFLISGAATVGAEISGAETPQPDSTATESPRQTPLSQRPDSNADPYAGAAPLVRPMSKDEYRANNQTNE